MQNFFSQLEVLTCSRLVLQNQEVVFVEAQTIDEDYEDSNSAETEDCSKFYQI